VRLGTAERWNWLRLYLISKCGTELVRLQPPPIQFFFFVLKWKWSFCHYCKSLCFCEFNAKKGYSIRIAEAGESRGTKLRSDPGITLSALSMAFKLEIDWGFELNTES
jgi:hypothetical protein